MTAALWLTVGSDLLTAMSRFPVFCCLLPDMGAQFIPVDSVDAFEAEQIVQRKYPGAITATISDKITDRKEISRLFLDWLAKV